MPARQPSSRRRSASEPTPGSLADLQADADPHAAARGIALRRLTAAPRTAHELRGDLLARGVDAAIADEVVERYLEVGLLDDEAYARMWVSSRARTKGTARPVLRQELRRKGVDDAVIAQVLAEVDDGQEAARGRALVEARLPGTARLDPPARMRRLVGALMRRGYGAGTAQRIVREALEAEGLHLDNVQIAE